MCGLAGILRTDGKRIPVAWLDALDAAIAPRGPDGHGRFHDSWTDSAGHRAEVALVHRRLSIIDLADGHQPMSVDDRRGRVAVVFNGCVYNHRTLRRELERRGHRFRSDHSDTETLLHGWREHGTALPAQLEGMYAFAIWDAKRGTLFVARDPFGEKPLWWLRPTDGVVAFASSAAALRAAFPDAPDGTTSPEVVAAFLRRGFGWGRQTDDALAPLDQLRPGTWTTVRADGRIETGRHHVAPTASNDPLEPDVLERTLDEAIAARLEADVPLGCFLSGGVDSALVATFARRRVPKLRTFCVRMPDPTLDESPRAAAIAAHLGTDHTTLDAAAPSGDGAAEDLVRLLGAVGVPFGDSSILPTHWVSRAARREVSVALSGDGGDELFLGYRRHVAAPTVTRLSPLLRLVPSAAIGLGTGWRGTLARLGDIARDLPTVGVAAFGAPFPDRLVRQLVPDGKRLPTVPVPHGEDARSALRTFDLTTYLPDDLLLKVDTASMAVALEVRAPLLDRTVAAMALAAPTRTLLHFDGASGRKAALRSVARRHLPVELVDGPKRGFAVPIGRWWREDHGGLGTLLRDALGSTEPFGSMPIDVAAARRLLDAHLCGKAEHGHRLFILLTLSLFARSPFMRSR